MISKQKRTPGEEKGYKVGDKFEVIDKSRFGLGVIIELVSDDNSESPLFRDSTGEEWFVALDSVKKIEDVSMIHSPSHYNNGEVECIVAIKASMTPTEFQGYLKGNAMKYLWRMGLKGKPLIDVQKAQWYVDKLREELNKQLDDLESRL